MCAILKENAFIRRLAVSKGAVNGLFLGASAQMGGPFGWIDGTVMDYDNYYPGDPYSQQASRIWKR